MLHNKRTILLALTLIASLCVHAKNVEFIENIYAQQAPEQLVAQSEEVAKMLNFEIPFEVGVPKKPGVQVNPWNKFIVHGINPQTTNPFIIINQEWFSSLPEGQQKFLLARSILYLKEGTTTFPIKAIPYIYSLLSILFTVLLYFAFGKTRLGHEKWWKRALLAYAITLAFNLAFMKSIQEAVTHYLGERYNTKISEMAIKQTGDRDAAIKAYETIDSVIKKQLQDGEVFFKPYETIFEEYAKALKK